MADQPLNVGSHRRTLYAASISHKLRQVNPTPDSTPNQPMARDFKRGAHRVLTDPVRAYALLRRNDHPTKMRPGGISGSRIRRFSRLQHRDAIGVVEIESRTSPSCETAKRCPAIPCERWLRIRTPIPGDVEDVRRFLKNRSGTENHSSLRCELMAIKVLIGPRVEAEIIRETLDLLEEKGYEATQTWLECSDRDDEVLELLRDKDAYLPGAELVSAEAIDEAKRLRVMARFGVGVDNIDLEAATRNGIVVTNAAGANRDAVADLVVGLMIGIARRIPWADRQMRNANWVVPVGKPVAETTLGMIGLGAIGKEVVRRLQGFDMKVLAYDVVRDPDFASRFDVQYAELEEILKNADFISLHVPLLKSTRGLIGREELQAMKPTACLINAARGGVVDESALHQALTEGWIAGAAADVFEHEPPEGSPLLELDNFIATPHMGVFTDRTLARVAMINAQATVDVLEGRRPQNVVNPQVYKLGLKPPPTD